MYLFFDTETTGLPDYSKDLTDPAQPHIVQLGMILADENGREMAACKLPILQTQPIDESGRAYEVHKLGNAALSRYGVSLGLALSTFMLFESRATLKIAHNYRFDGFLLKVAHARAGVAQKEPPIDKFCTMKCIADARGEKFPKLASIYKEVTGLDLDNAHDALADVRACKDVFFWIMKQGLYKPQPRYVPKPAEAAA